MGRKVLIIIPAYNEEQSIVNTVKSLDKIKISGYIIDYIVINDCSKDKTLELCLKNKIKHINLPCNLGIGGAVQTGYKYANYNNYDIAVQFDGDGQHNANYIEILIKELDTSDMVIGSRFLEENDSFKSTKVRRIGIRFLSRIIKICTKSKITDPTSGFRACTKNVIEVFSKEYPSDYPEPDTTVMLLKRGYQIKEVSVNMNERNGGTSSITLFRSVYYMVKVGLSIIITSLGNRKEK